MDWDDVCKGAELFVELGDEFKHDVLLLESTKNVLDFVMPRLGFAVSKATRAYCPGGTLATGLWREDQ